MKTKYRGIIASVNSEASMGIEFTEAVFKELNNIPCITEKLKFQRGFISYIFFESTENLNEDDFNKLVSLKHIAPLVFNKEAYDKWEESNFEDMAENVGFESGGVAISMYSMESNLFTIYRLLSTEDVCEPCFEEVDEISVDDFKNGFGEGIATAYFMDNMLHTNYFDFKTGRSQVAFLHRLVLDLVND